MKVVIIRVLVADEGMAHRVESFVEHGTFREGLADALNGLVEAGVHVQVRDSEPNWEESR